MKVEIKVPELGEDSGQEATVSFWYIGIGDTVGEGDDIVELVTDKATFNVASPAWGKVAEILSQEGDVVKPGQVLGTVESED